MLMSVLNFDQRQGEFFLNCIQTVRKKGFDKKCYEYTFRIFFINKRGDKVPLVHDLCKPNFKGYTPQFHCQNRQVNGHNSYPVYICKNFWY